MKNYKTLLFIFIILLLFKSISYSEELIDYGTLNFYFENDSFTHKDVQYTNGFKLSWLSKNIDIHENESSVRLSWPRQLINKLFCVNGKRVKKNWGVFVGQSIFTPSDLERSDIIEDDRPYAGISYFGLGLYRKNKHQMNSLNLFLGLVGSHSYANKSQELFHNVNDSSSPEGWDNQLEDEPVINASFQRRWNILKTKKTIGMGYDLINYLEAGLGNIITYTGLGTKFRFGWNLPDDYGTSIIKFGCHENSPIDDKNNPYKKKNIGIHAFAAVQGQAVFRNIFLDGNTFKDSHSVDKKPLVADLIAGIELTYREFKLSYSTVYRTKEFETQDDEHTYGSLVLSYSY